MRTARTRRLVDGQVMRGGKGECEGRKKRGSNPKTRAKAPRTVNDKNWNIPNQPLQTLHSLA